MVSVVIVEAPGFDETLMDALALRLPGRTLIDEDASRPEGGLVYARLEVDVEGLLHITLITDDGRAFDRELEVEPDQRTRVAASALANLLFSVESGDVQPDRVQVEIPPSPDEGPAPAKGPAATPRSETPVSRPVEQAPDLPRFELSAVAYAAALLGLAPSTQADVFAGGGAGLGVELRVRGGALAMLGLRAAGRTEAGVRLARIRIAAGAGYAWRWKHAELLLSGALTIEPWLLRREGGPPPLVRDGRDRPPRPLLGAMVRLSPGWMVRPGAGTIALRVGPRLELAGSFLVDDGIKTADVLIAREDGTTRAGFRLGGIELVGGIEVAVWFPLAKSSRPR